jgi:hypothetical protein
MKTKFTSGEWYVYERGIDCGVGVGCSGIRICELSLLSDDVITKEENTANANLIAAAPDMYAEIESDIKDLEDRLLDISTLSGDYDLIHGRIIHKKTLLAKAGGEL